MTALAGEGIAYRYRAARADGSIERGEISATTRDGARAALSDRGLLPMELVARSPLARRQRLATDDLALGLRMLASLLEAGLPISRALGAFGDLAPTSWQPALVPLGDAVREGYSLGTALSQSPLQIPPLVIGIIQAGEAGSGLPGAVRSAAELTEQAATTSAAIRAALTYPAILIAAGAASIGLLVGVVLPRFASILADLGQSLPASTQFVLAFATVVREGALPATLVAVVLLMCWRAWTASSRGRQRWHALLLQLPRLGTIRRSASTARVCSATAALLRSGVPIATALQHAAVAAGDAHVAARLLQAREQVVTGSRISRALIEAQALTMTASRLVRAGEETGRLAELLEHASRIERERAQELTRSSVRLLEPTTILVFGGIVAFIAAAPLQAVYSVRPGA